MASARQTALRWLVAALGSLALVAAAQQAPTTLELPGGFQPEGVAAGEGNTLYAGSLADGAIYQVDVASGQGRILAPGEAGRVTVGLAYDPRSGYLYAAGGNTGQAHVFDTASGELLASFTLTDGGTFVNDAVVNGDAVYFTDSNRNVLYKLELGENGALPEGDGAVSELAIQGAFQSDANVFNANGIAAAEDGTLIVVKSNTGQLFTVDPASGESREIDLGGDTVTNGDGLLLEGNTLYVVQNQNNRVAVVELANDLASGSVTDAIESPDFDVPTTIASVGGTLYAVNARFGTEATPETSYSVVRLERP